MEKLTNYTLGFIFNKDLTKVLLIQFPTRGKWNDGFINGVGGHIEENESPSQCMQREAEEETNINFQPDWVYSGRYDGIKADNPFLIFTYYTIIDENSLLPFEGEEGFTNWYTINEISQLKTVSNLQWMVPFCIAKAQKEILGTFNANYK